MISGEETCYWLCTTPINLTKLCQYKFWIALLSTWIWLIPFSLLAQLMDGSGWSMLLILWAASTSLAIVQYWNSVFGQFLSFDWSAIRDKGLYAVQMLMFICWCLCAALSGPMAGLAGLAAMGLFAIASLRHRSHSRIPST